MRILIIDPDLPLASFVAEVFRRRGFAVEVAATIAEGDRRLATSSYALVLLDWAFPGDAGVEFLRRLRRRDALQPLLVVSERASLEDRIAALHLGADDHLAKPFALAELVARADAVLRRGVGGRSATVTLGRIDVDTERRVARVDGADLDLTRREFAVLEALALEAGRAVTKQALYDRIFDAEAESGINAIEIYVHRLRKKLLPFGVQIRTLRGIGYAIEASPRLVAASRGARLRPLSS